MSAPASPAGARIDYRVTFLEMTERPSYDWPQLPADGVPASLLRAETPPVWYFRALYDAVGRDHAWEDLEEESDEDVAAWLSEPDVGLWSLIRAGWPQGFFILDTRGAGETELTLFGLVPGAIGLGLGRYLLRTAVLTAWERPGLARLKVNTCSLDHPRALALYQRNGFQVVAQEMRSRVLKRGLDPARWRP
jgi:GNAT superfamily N-acetyltransferase